MTETFPNNPAQAVVGMPLKTGEIYVSDASRKILEPLGWQDQDPIPPQFGDKLKEIQERIRNAKITIPEGVDPNQQLAPPSPVDISSLPESDKAELMAVLAQAKNQPQGVITSAVDTAESLATNLQAHWDKHAAEAKAVAARPADAATETPAAVSTAADTAAALYTTCPQCSWHMADKFETEVSDDEKHRFMESFLGNRPFCWETSLFGNKIVLTFRDISPEEEHKIQQHLIGDTRSGAILYGAEWLTNAQNYRRAYSLISVQGSMQAEWRQLSAAELSGKSVAEVFEAHLRSISSAALMHTVNKKFKEFQRKIELLEANVGDASFW